MYAILAARIDRLAPQDKRLLQAAAVVGKDVPYPLLQAVAELPEGMLRQGLSDLQAAEFLYELSLFPDLEYTFKHALTHEVAYGGVLQERRRALHRRIVDVIERLYADRLPEQVEHLAHHAFRGEAWEKAASYLRQTGDKAWGRSATREAVNAFEHALTALAHLPQVRETLEQAVDLRFLLCGLFDALTEPVRSFQYAREAQVLAAQLDDPLRRGAVVAHLCYAHVMLGEPAAAIEPAKTAASDAAVEATKGSLRYLATRIAVFQLEQEHLPQKLDDLLAPTPNYPKGFVDGDKLPTDGWQHAFAYQLSDDRAHYRLWSIGPDGVDANGSGDDLLAP